MTHKVLWVLPRNVVDVFEYTKLLANHYGVSWPKVSVDATLEQQNILGMYWQPDNISFWTNPTYELIVYHEFLHYLGNCHSVNPCQYVQEIYFVKKKWFQFWKRPEIVHNYCGYCRRSE